MFTTSPVSPSVSLASTGTVVETSSEVVTGSTTALGERLKKVREISRRTQSSTANSTSGGCAGPAGPGARNGDSSVATTVVTNLTATPGRPSATSTGPEGCATRPAMGA